MLATFVRNRGFSVEILDADAEELAPEDVARRADETGAKLTTVMAYGNQPSASTQNLPAARDVCEAIQKQGTQTKLLLIGGHVAALPEQTLRELPVDYVCTGEGPHTLIGLLEMLKGGRPEDVSKVLGLIYWEGETVRANPSAPLIADLDQDFPQLAWDLLPMDKYRAHNWHSFGGLKREPYASFYTTLGCPYHCSFCCIQAPFKGGEKLLGYSEKVNSYRRWSPETMVAQLDHLVNTYGVHNVKITDEMFVLNRGHVTGICDLIIERGYDLNFWAYARIDSINEKDLEKLKRAGFNWLAFGIESGDQGVRKDVDKAINQDQIYKTIELVRNAGINVIANFIYGLPDDSIESMQATTDMALELNCEFANFYCAMAYPGSRLYTMALENGWLLPAEWTGYSQHSVDTLPLPTKYLSGAEVLRFRDEAFQVYFNSPGYLDLINRKFGPETLTQVRAMTSHKLTRNILSDVSV